MIVKVRAADENVVTFVFEYISHHLVLVCRDAADHIDDERLILKRMHSLLRVHQVAELERFRE